MNIDTNKYNNILHKAAHALRALKECEQKLEQAKENMNSVEKEMKSLLAKGYWWTFDIDKDWYPKKYSIKDVTCDGNKFIIKIKEVCKKGSRRGCNGEYYYDVQDFNKINVYKTEKDAQCAYVNRICPNCGKPMGYSTYEWCKECLDKMNVDLIDYLKHYEPYYKEYYRVYNYKVPKVEQTKGSVWVRGEFGSAEITDRRWIDDYKNKLHPNDDWSNVDVETYGRWILAFDREECENLINEALANEVVGYLD